ncbi:MAG: hypothetical protein DME26_09670 [Verrucomicrobia bacterium]|nr:MAG: hypothetical protein DME26_09670 [Verrucomicrobiota bacterium]
MILLIICLVFLARALWHNFFLKLSAKEFAAQAGAMAAAGDFARGRVELYEIKLYKFDLEKDSGPVPTDGMTRLTGRSDGPFQIRAFLVDQQYPKVHEDIQKAFVDADNQRMRRVPNPNNRGRTN